MKQLHLTRFGSIPLQGTPGELVVMNGWDEELRLKTLEPDWNQNAREVSCIPAGEYQLTPYRHHSRGLVYLLHNPRLRVARYAAPWAERDEIMIHAGNQLEDTLGCILPGDRFSGWNGYIAVANSVDAMDALRGALGEMDEHKLTITWHPHQSW